MSSMEINELLKRVRDVKTDILILQRKLAHALDRIKQVEGIAEELKPSSPAERDKEDKAPDG